MLVFIGLNIARADDEATVGTANAGCAEKQRAITFFILITFYMDIFYMDIIIRGICFGT